MMRLPVLTCNLFYCTRSPRNGAHRTGGNRDLNHPAPQTNLPLVKHHHLPGSHGALRRVEVHAQAVAVGGDGAGLLGLPVADARGEAHGQGGGGADPVRLPGQ